MTFYQHRIFLSVLALFLIMGTGWVQAQYYGVPLNFVEESYWTYHQTYPDIGYDFIGQLHMVYVGDYTGYPRIYHRMRHTSGTYEDSVWTGNDTYCGTGDCPYEFPQIALSPVSEIVWMAGYSVFNTEPYIPAAEGDFASLPPAWNEIISPEVISVRSNQVSVVSIGTHFYIAYGVLTDLKIRRYAGGFWDQDYTIPGSANLELRNPNLAVDDDGYIYLVYDENDYMQTNPRAVIAMRSLVADSLSGGFTAERLVVPRNSDDLESDPAIYVTGAYSTTNLQTAVAFKAPLGLGSAIYCRYEGNTNWTSGTMLSGSLSTASTYTAIDVASSNPDVVIDNQNVIHIVWEDDRVFSGMPQIYAAQSFNQAAFFLQDKSISTDGALQGKHPKIAKSPVTDEVTVSYQSTGTWDHVYVLVKNQDLKDECNNLLFTGWTSHSGIDLGSMGHTGTSYRFHTNTMRGSLVRDYTGSEVTGNIEFWFYDSLWVDQDFQFRIEGDDGSKAGVYRMLGINNATTPTNYSIHNGNSWIDSGRSRGVAAWHHVVLTVDSAGIVMYLDPETVVNPIYQSSAPVWFDRIEFSGGSDAHPYFVDDIIIVEDLTATVPALSAAGLVLLALAISIGFLRKRSR